jgi:hypothetical protein
MDTLKYMPASLFLLFVFPAATLLAAPDGSWEWPGVGLAWAPGGGAGVLIQELFVWDDGAGPALYVGGSFYYAGEKPAGGIARWNGEEWFPLPGMEQGSSVSAMAAFDDGEGLALYATGGLTAGAANGIAKWTGNAWEPLGAGITCCGSAIVPFDDGSGSALYVGGSFGFAGGQSSIKRLAKWDGSAWAKVGGGVSGSAVYALAVYDNGGGPALYVGGFFWAAGGRTIMNIAKWDGENWSALGAGLPAEGFVTAMTVFDDGSGPKLFVSGQFDQAGGIPANGMATWDGEAWGKADGGLENGFYAGDFAVLGEGPSAVLYAIGSPSARRWNGSAWEALPPLAINSFSHCGAAFDDGAGPRLHIGGSIYMGQPNGWTNIARWSIPGGSPSPCGDLNGDGFVNQQDLGILLADYGCTKGKGLCPGDCDGDGDTDQSDLGILLSNYEKACP